MTIDLTHILIFKTNINTELDKLRVAGMLSNQYGVEEWNVDMDDVDRVLRVVSHELSVDDVIKQVTAMGYQCCELE